MKRAWQHQLNSSTTAGYQNHFSLLTGRYRMMKRSLSANIEYNLISLLYEPSLLYFVFSIDSCCNICTEASFKEKNFETPSSGQRIFYEQMGRPRKRNCYRKNKAKQYMDKRRLLRRIDGALQHRPKEKIH